LREVQQSAGYGRTKPAPIVAIALVPPKTTAKERFRTHEAIVIPQWDGITGNALRPFLSRCQQRHLASLYSTPETQDATLIASTTLDASVLKIGTRLGRYEILAPLGEGGMGKVYRARDSRLDRDVAIKVLSAGLITDEGARRRFYKEALALAHFNHPHIAVIYDVGEVAGVDYLVMECVNGDSLKEKLKNGALMEEEVLFLGVQIAEALEEAHDQGIIHRDLKPGNVMVTAKQQVKVLDFGLAKLRATAESSPETQSIAGTVRYMAPEQLGGEPVDARADLYALGTVLFEMAVGRRLFPEDSMIRLFDAIVNQQPVLARTINPTVSEELERIIDKAVQKNRDLRYQTAADLGADLTKLRDTV
jgi:serine/threonine protein kinase